MPLLEDVRAYLGGLGLVDGATGWPCYVAFMPDETDQCVGLYELPGLPPDTLARENENLSFGIRVRAARWKYAVARAKWAALFDALQDAQEGSLPASPDPLEGVVLVQAFSQGPEHANDTNGRPCLSSRWRVKRLR